MIDGQSIGIGLYRDSVIESSGIPLSDPRTLPRVKKPRSDRELSDYGRRLTHAMAHAQIDQAALVLRSGLRQSTVSSAFIQSSSRSNTLLASACGVDPRWLETGEGAMVMSAASPQTPVSSESFALYVQDVSRSVEELAQVLNDAQRGALRNTIRVIFADRLNFVNLDLNHLLPLLSDNSYSKRLGKGPGKPLQPISSSASRSVTKMIGFGEQERTDGEGSAPRPDGGKRGH